jgi:hypothetical protein
MRNNAFKGSRDYWEKRYSVGGNSGRGSYGELAKYKADILNHFIQEKNISSVMEFGCGDGNQLTLASYPLYTGLDVSATAIQTCIQKFSADTTKSFYLYDSKAFQDHAQRFRSTLCLSLDVVYHLIEWEVYEAYLHDLFETAEKYVIIYAWDVEGVNKVHVQHRKFSQWIETNKKNWTLIKVNTHIPKHAEACDFFFYEKIS